MSLEQLLYCGEDEDVFSLLSALSAKKSCKVISCSLATATRTIHAEWDLVIVLDLDEVQNPIDTLRSLKAVNAGVPILVVASLQQLPLTLAAVVRANGAEGLFWKPITKMDELDEALEAAFTRLGRWKHSIQQVATSGLEPSDLR